MTDIPGCVVCTDWHNLDSFCLLINGLTPTLTPSL